MHPLPHTLLTFFPLSFSSFPPLQPSSEYEIGQLSLHHQRAAGWPAVSQSSWLGIQSSDVHWWCSLPRYFTSLTHLSLGSCTIITDKAVMSLFPCKHVVDLLALASFPVLIPQLSLHAVQICITCTASDDSCGGGLRTRATGTI